MTFACKLLFSVLLVAFLCISAGLSIVTPNDAHTQVDVAEGKAAMGSSTMIIFKDRVMHRSSAALAVNGLDNQQRYLSLGNSSDYVFSDVCTVILNIMGESWWYVNLAATYRITAVIVWGIPDDKHANENGFFQIYITTNDDSRLWFGELNAPLDSNQGYLFGATNDITGEGVRISKHLRSSTALTLCKVAVYTYASSTAATTTVKSRTSPTLAIPQTAQLTTMAPFLHQLLSPPLHEDNLPLKSTTPLQLVPLNTTSTATPEITSSFTTLHIALALTVTSLAWNIVLTLALCVICRRQRKTAAAMETIPKRQESPTSLRCGGRLLASWL